MFNSMESRPLTDVKKHVVILGTTGNIGGMCLDVLKGSCYQIVGITGYSQKDKLNSIKDEFSVQFASSLMDESVTDFVETIADNYSPNDTIFINAIDGFDGLKASIEVIHHGFDIILANKETIVAGGRLFLDDVKSRGVNIIPIDSEMYALSSLIKMVDSSSVDKYIITASGGAFLSLKRAELHGVTYSDAIKHPVWRMGNHISLNSATLLNKALEIIEARNLFNLDNDKIEVVIHKEGFVHGALLLKNGTLIPQVYPPSQKVAIRNTLELERESSQSFLERPLTLNFEKPDFERFPFLTLGFDALSSDSKAVVLLSRGEAASEMFRNGKIAFDEIEGFVKSRYDELSTFTIKSYDDIFELDRLSRIV